jgi:hypothetical protein
VSRRRATRLAWALWCATLALSVAVIAVVFFALERGGGLSDTAYVLALVAAQLFVTVGALIASRRPENPIGWLFCAAPIVAELAILVEGWAYLAAERGLPGVAPSKTVAGALWGVAVTLVGLYAFLLFPDGRLPSPRWRWPALAGAVTLAVYVVAAVTVPGPIPAPEGYDNPIGVPGMGAVAELATLVFIGLMLAAVASLLLRFRMARGVERQQLRVFLATVCFVIATIGAFELLVTATDGPIAGLHDTDKYAVWVVDFLLIPVAVGVALLRYRLYDFDRVVSKTLVYGGLTAILGAAYVGLVLAGQTVFSSFAGGSDLAIAASTLVVAALFLPLRARVQRFVDRRFYRRRYDAQRLLEAFGARLREELELEMLRADLENVVAETMQPAHVSLWVAPRRNPVTIP